MSIKTKILFVQTFRKSLIKNASQQTFRKIASQFIQNDLDILRRHFEVRVAHYQGKKRLLKFLIETLKGVLWADLTFSWFADVHALVAVLFSKIFRRKSIVVVGGYEVAKVPEIGRG
jgi:hypothetical protein